MKEIEFSRWLLEGRPMQGKNVLPDGLNWLCHFATHTGPEMSVSSIGEDAIRTRAIIIKVKKCKWLVVLPTELLRMF